MNDFALAEDDQAELRVVAEEIMPDAAGVVPAVDPVWDARADAGHMDLGEWLRNLKTDERPAMKPRRATWVTMCRYVIALPVLSTFVTTLVTDFVRGYS